MNKWLTPIATFKGSGDAQTKEMLGQDHKYDSRNEFIAIAEGITLPLYVFTYNIEMTQFVFTDMMKNPDQEECLDKSLLSRHHAQFISHQIADEARLNNHIQDLGNEGFDRLIKHHKVISIDNWKDSDEGSHEFNPMPKGLEEHDVYLVNHRVA